MDESLSEIVKRLRSKAGLSQAALAERLGRSAGAVGHWESGTRGMDPETVDAFAEGLELNATERRRLAQAAARYRRENALSIPARLDAVEVGLGELRGLVAEIQRRLPPARGGH